MGNYFGTDGIRGVVNENLTPIMAFNCGNALTIIKEKPIVVIGQDTRESGDMLSAAFSAGVTAGGGTVLNLGIMQLLVLLL